VHSNSVEGVSSLSGSGHASQEPSWHAFRPVSAAQVVNAFETSTHEDAFLEDTIPLPAYRAERLW
jgi:hypothetical protein